MASTSTRPETSTSPQCLHDVFLSFRGEDTRKNFTDHLYSALVRHGFSTFRDDNELKRGEEIGPELLKSIERSRISVVVFSRNYADSSWCLDELVKILECKSTFQQMVVPVFFDVDPSDVRAQRGSFEKAFVKHEERYKARGMECKLKLQKWRAALTEASNLSGWDLQNVADGHESKFIGKIVEDISNKLNLPSLNVADYLVSMESRVQQINMMLSLGSNDVRMVGIWGVGGLGKTTIAKAIYKQIRPQFEGSSFLANVREISKQSNGLVGLQEQLLSDILMNENRNIRNVDQGIEVIKQRLWCRRVLVVLDDIDNVSQLKALAIRRDWFYPGSRIIVTTRDESLLNILEVDGKYEPNFLNEFESLKLFKWYAFREDHPIEDYAELSREVVHYTGGLPLAIEVLGSFFKGMSVIEWKSALESLKVIPHEDIQSKLRVSFDSLNDEEKALFLDIACFFGMMEQSYIEVEGVSFFPRNVLGVLSRRCLINIIVIPGQFHRESITMHDLLRDMGKDIARREHQNPRKRRRLWFRDDILDVLKNDMGTKAVESLVINLCSVDDVQLNTQAFAKMKRLRLLDLSYVHLSGSYEHLSNGLRWLRWFGFPLKSIPSKLCLEQVVVIDMCYNRMKQVWKGRKILKKLKILNLSHSYHLTKIPNLSGCTSLELLLLNDCKKLVEVHQSVECLDKLVVLELEDCINLRKLPLKLKSLQFLSLRGCSKIGKLLGSEGSPSKSLVSLFSSRALLVRNPDSINHSPVSIGGLISMRKLRMEGCNLSSIPDEIGSLISLNSLYIGGNNFCTLPTSIRNLYRLQILSVENCTRLQSLPELPINMELVSVEYCTSLERISIGPNLQGSMNLHFKGCHKLTGRGDFVKRLLQIKEPRKLNFYLPSGDDVLDCYEESTARECSYRVPLGVDRKIRGYVTHYVCTHYRYPRDYEYPVQNETEGVEGRQPPINFEFLHRESRLQYVCYPEKRVEAGDEIKFRIPSWFGDDFSVVNKWGINLIYEDDEGGLIHDERVNYDCHSCVITGEMSYPRSPFHFLTLQGEFKHLKPDRSVLRDPRVTQIIYGNKTKWNSRREEFGPDLSKLIEQSRTLEKLC